MLRWLFRKNEKFLILRSRGGGKLRDTHFAKTQICRDCEMRKLELQGLEAGEFFVHVDGEELEGVFVGGFDEDVSFGFV